MEMHLVFFRKQYSNIQSAMESLDDLVVLSFSFHVRWKIVENSCVTSAINFFIFQLNDIDNSYYVEFIEVLPRILEPKSVAELTHSNSITDLILNDLDEYYMYRGSLMLSPCSENVMWIDFKQTIPLSRSQVLSFLSIFACFTFIFLLMCEIDENGWLMH